MLVLQGRTPKVWKRRKHRKTNNDRRTTYYADGGTLLASDNDSRTVFATSHLEQLGRSFCFAFVRQSPKRAHFIVILARIYLHSHKAMVVNPPYAYTIDVISA